MSEMNCPECDDEVPVPERLSEDWETDCDGCGARLRGNVTHPEDGGVDLAVVTRGGAVVAALRADLEAARGDLLALTEERNLSRAFATDAIEERIHYERAMGDARQESIRLRAELDAARAEAADYDVVLADVREILGATSEDVRVDARRAREELEEARGELGGVQEERDHWRQECRDMQAALATERAEREALAKTLATMRRVHGVSYGQLPCVCEVCEDAEKLIEAFVIAAARPEGGGEADRVAVEAWALLYELGPMRGHMFDDDGEPIKLVNFDSLRAALEAAAPREPGREGA